MLTVNDVIQSPARERVLMTLLEAYRDRLPVERFDFYPDIAELDQLYRDGYVLFAPCSVAERGPHYQLATKGLKLARSVNMYRMRERRAGAV